MRCLFIVAQYPISPNFRGGGSATFYERLSSLSALGHEIHLWHYAYPKQRAAFDAFVQTDADTYRRVREMCASVQLTTLPETPRFLDRVRARIDDWTTGTYVENPVFRTVALKQLRQTLDRVDPAFIWTQHFGPARLATLQRSRPVVYSHHDWLYRVRAIGQQGDENARMRRQEEDVALAAAGVVSGSFTECQQLRDLGCKVVTYIPVSYEPVPWTGAAPSGPPRIVHLGGLGTTANRVGLERFFEVAWPQLSTPSSPDLWVIGDTSAAGATLSAHLKPVRCPGHVQDLGTVLRPFDLHIIPWEHDTGQRTRLPLIFNYGQVVVAVKASVACFPEVRDGDNCRLVNRLDDMAPVIRELLEDAGQRRRLGLRARQTFERVFTRPALLPRYAETLAALAPCG